LEILILFHRHAQLRVASDCVVVRFLVFVCAYVRVCVLVSCKKTADFVVVVVVVVVGASFSAIHEIALTPN